MEKYSQYRDRGSGIAPFFAIQPQSVGIYLPIYVVLFCLKACAIFTSSILYFVIFTWFPTRSWAKKSSLSLVLWSGGIFWSDLQIDGVRRGSLAKQSPKRLPGPQTIIASSYTSPVDVLYLALIFDPVFTASFPNIRKVQRLSLFQALLRAFANPQTEPSPKARLTSLTALLRETPDASIAVFPECTTTNGRGILPLSQCLLSVPADTKIYPVSLRYTPADVTTPLPHTYFNFLWNLLSRPTHSLRIRVAEAVHNTSMSSDTEAHVLRKKNSYETNFFDAIQLGEKLSNSEAEDVSEYGDLTSEERRVLDRIGEDLARLGRVKRVGLGVAEKEKFINAWYRKRR